MQWMCYLLCKHEWTVLFVLCLINLFNGNLCLCNDCYSPAFSTAISWVSLTPVIPLAGWSWTQFLCSSLIMKLSLIETAGLFKWSAGWHFVVVHHLCWHFVAASATGFGHFRWYKVAQGEHIHCRSPFLLWSDCFTDYHYKVWVE